MISKYFLFLFAILMVGSIGPISAVTEFDAPPIDEVEKEDEFIEQVWVIAVVIVGSLIAARIAFQIIVKKRRQQADEY